MQTVTCAFEDLSLDDRPGERWQPVPGLELYYEVSDQGRLRRLAGSRTDKRGFARKLPAKIIKPTISKAANAFTGDSLSYLTVTLWLNEKAYHFSMARLVYHCFIEPFDLKDRNLFIFYKDGNGLNLDPDNLVLGDQKDKQQRMESSGRRSTPFRDMTPEKRKAIQEKIKAVKAQTARHVISRYSLSGKLLETYLNAEVAAQAVGSNAGTLSKAARGKLASVKGYRWRRGAEPEIAVPNGKRLGQYDLEGRLVNTYPSIKEAAQKLKLTYNHISSCVSGRKLTYGGYLWRWSSKKKISIKNLTEAKGYRYSPASVKERTISQYNLDGIWQKTYPHIAAAEKATGTDWKSIQWAATGKAITAGGYLWRQGTALRIKTQPLTKLPGYKNSALERHRLRKRA